MNDLHLLFSCLLVQPRKLASIGATFHEDITGFTGKKLQYDGYFTGTAQQTALGWKLQNAHWSLIVQHQ